MFENIIGNTTTISILKHELSSGTMPRAALFHGPAYTGKLSTALEIARVLVCDKRSARWNCTCHQCRLNRELLHPYVTLLGSRYFGIEIAASGDALYRTRKQSSQYLFIRAVRKLTRRFDPAIWEGDEVKRKKIQDLIIQIEEMLDAAGPHNALPEKKALSNLIASVIGLCSTLSSYISDDNIPISHIRKAVQWAHLSAPNSPKIIILENAENMLESSRNSLLKILEEPPPHVYLILTATRLTNIIPTIRSRLRHYKFMSRAEDQVKEILKRIFNEESLDFASLQSYFLAWQDISAATLNNLAKTFFQKVLEPKDSHVDILEDMQELFSSQSTNKLISLFIQTLLQVLNNYFLDNLDEETSGRQLHTDQMENLIKIIGKRYKEHKTLNLQTRLFIENLFYQMKAVL
jgi:DNA polymerase III delta prime subunit